MTTLKGWMQPTGFEPVPLMRLAPKASALTTRPKLLLFGTSQHRSPHTRTNPTPNAIVCDSHSLLRSGGKGDGLNVDCRPPAGRMLSKQTQAPIPEYFGSRLSVASGYHVRRYEQLDLCLIRASVSGRPEPGQVQPVCVLMFGGCRNNTANWRRGLAR